MIQTRKKRSLEKHKGQAMEKNSTTKTGKKVKKTSRPKKAPKSPEFIDSSKEEEEGPPKDNKGEKNTSFTGTKEEVQSFLNLQKDGKKFENQEKGETGSFYGGIL